jgi:hypothetical protein
LLPSELSVEIPLNVRAKRVPSNSLVLSIKGRSK